MRSNRSQRHTRSSRGISWAVAGFGSGGGGGIAIVLSNATIAVASANGTVLGTAAIVGPHSGTATWALTDVSGTFQINSSTGVVTVLSNTDLASPTTIPIVISVTGTTPLPAALHVTVAVVSTTSPELDFSKPGNSQYINIFTNP